MMMKRFPILTLLLPSLLLAQYACGWMMMTTTATTSRPSRRGFLAGGAAVSGLATIVTASASFPNAAVAADAATAEATKNKKRNNPTASTLVEPGSLTGKVMVITGGSTGLGLESAKDLAQGGATVVLTARTDAKGQAAVDTIQAALSGQGISNPNVYYVTLDLDRLDNVRTFCDRFRKVLPLNPSTKIDVLMNNAGVMAIPQRQLTVDGYERTFQSNHLGHFLLTALLFPYLSDTARIINVSSLGYQFAGGPLDLNNINGDVSYGPWQSYGYSKLENILFTQELQRRLDAAGRMGMTAVSLHPGAVNTDLARNMMGGEEKWNEKKRTGPTNVWEKFLDQAISTALLTIDEGAATQVYLASTTATASTGDNNNNNNPSLVKGAFYNNLKPEKLPAFATNPNDAQQLWELSERLSGATFNIAAAALPATTVETR